MNLLFLNYEYPPLGGGAGNATKFLARACLELGHRAVVLTSGLDEQPAHAIEDGVDIYRLRTRRERPDRSNMREMFVYYFMARREAAEIVRRHSCQAVIAFFTLPSGPVARRLHRTAGLPYLISLRGGDVPGLVPELKWIHRLLAPWRRGVLRSAAAIIANDEELARLERLADHVPVEVIHNGVDCVFFRPAAPPADPPQGQPLRWLFCGRVHHQKNLLQLLQEFAWLRQQHPAAGELDLVGDGPMRPELERAADRLGIAQVVRWHGWQSKAQLLLHYQAAGCFLNPSLYEGMPNTVLEAMACGLPVIASNVGGNSTLVRPEENGLLFDLGRPGALGAAMARMLAEPSLRRQWGRQGRARAEREFSWSRSAEKYLELLAGYT